MITFVSHKNAGYEEVGTDNFYEQIFDNLSEPRIIIKADSPRFTIMRTNASHKLSTNTVGQDVVGKSTWEVFKPDEANGDAGDRVMKALNTVISTKASVKLPPFRYDIQGLEGQVIESYWELEYVPIFNSQYDVSHILGTTQNVTNVVLSERALEAATEQEKALKREHFVNEQLGRNIRQLNELNQKLEETRLSLQKANEELEQRVVARTKDLAQKEAMMRTAVTQAKLGTWFLEMETGAFSPSARLKKILGFREDEEMTFDEALEQVSQDQRRWVRAQLNQAISSGRKYDIEYKIVGRRDKRVRWIRATGNIIPANGSEPTYFYGFVQDITERKLDDIRKNDFITMASHELKTPLTTLKGYAEILLKQSECTDDFNRKALEKIDKQARKMTSMINGFLNISSMETGKIFLEKRPFIVDDLIKESIEEVILTHPNQKIDYFLCNLRVNADYEKIAQVMHNLLTNAIKYSVQSPIVITCHSQHKTIMISVKDQGMGIEKKHLPKIFERFYRVKSDDTKHISGFGVGLYLSAEIINRHYGKMWVDSELGIGSTFHFTLPNL